VSKRVVKRAYVYSWGTYFVFVGMLLGANRVASEQHAIWSTVSFIVCFFVVEFVVSKTKLSTEVELIRLLSDRQAPIVSRQLLAHAVVGTISNALVILSIIWGFFTVVSYFFGPLPVVL